MVAPPIRRAKRLRQRIQPPLQSLARDQIRQLRRAPRPPCLRVEPPRVDPRPPIRRGLHILPAEIPRRPRVRPNGFDQRILRIGKMRRQGPALTRGRENLEIIRKRRAPLGAARVQPVQSRILRSYFSRCAAHPSARRHHLAPAARHDAVFKNPRHGGPLEIDEMNQLLRPVFAHATHATHRALQTHPKIFPCSSVCPAAK